jgi:hypothetical protein
VGGIEGGGYNSQDSFNLVSPDNLKTLFALKLFT